MTETKIILIRHGETVFNTEGKIQGSLDSPLTKIGVQQAQAVARRLRSEPLAKIYTSDLGRALETAKLIAAPAHHPLQPVCRTAHRILSGRSHRQGLVRRVCAAR